MLGKLVTTTVISAALCVTALAQTTLGTAAEAKAMLEKAAAAVKADKAKAIETFNKGEGGFKDRDLYPFCFNMSDGQFVAGQAAFLGKDARALKDSAGKAIGEEIYQSAQEGRITETNAYMFPRPGQTEPSPKVSFVTRIGDVACAVGYHK